MPACVSNGLVLFNDDIYYRALGKKVEMSAFYAVFFEYRGNTPNNRQSNKQGPGKRIPAFELRSHI